MPEGSESEAVEVDSGRATSDGQSEPERMPEEEELPQLEGQGGELRRRHPEQPASEQPDPEPEPEPAAAVDEDGEPERLDAAFEILVGFDGQPTAAAAAAAAGAGAEFAPFYVQVNDNRPTRPRSITVWRLGSASDDDRGVSRAVLHGCNARMCDSAGGMPTGAFELRLAAYDEGVAR